MRISSFSPRSSLAVVLGAAVAGAVPAAAQTFVMQVGEPIPYRVELPALAQISENGGVLRAENGGLVVEAGAMDMMQRESGNQLPVSDAEARRVLTTVFMTSDSLLLGMLTESLREQNLEVSNVVTEIRTLGGQRSGYLRGSFMCSCGHPGVIEMHVTVKDGILYVLTFTGRSENMEGYAPLMARIHESFVLADAPPPVASRPRPGVLRRTSRS